MPSSSRHKSETQVTLGLPTFVAVSAGDVALNVRDAFAQAYGTRVDPGAPVTHLRPVPPSPPRSFSQDFWDALGTLSEHGVDRAVQARCTRLAAMIQQLPVTEPSITLTDDNDVRFTWFKDRYTMHLDVLLAGGCRWYFRRAEPQAGAEGDVCKDDPPVEVWQRLRLAGA